MADLYKLRRRKFLVEMFILGCAIFAFGWIGTALVLIFGDAELRQHIFSVFGYLWLWLGIIPLCGFTICSVSYTHLGQFEIQQVKHTSQCSIKLSNPTTISPYSAELVASWP